MDSTRTFHDFVPRLNEAYAGEDQDLFYIRLDDRGDLGCYVWTGGGIDGPDDAIEEAEEHAAGEEWEVLEEDIQIFPVDGSVREAAVKAAKRAAHDIPEDVTWLDRAQSTEGAFDPELGYVLACLEGEEYAVSGRYAGVPDDEEARQLVCALHFERFPPEDPDAFEDENGETYQVVLDAVEIGTRYEPEED